MWGGTHVASAEREPIKRVWGAEPLSNQGEAKAENLLAFGCSTEAACLSHSPYFANSLNLWYL